MRIFVSIIVFFSFFDLFSQLPVMSTFAVSLGAASFITGLVVGMYSLANIFGNILSGFMTDKRGPFFILVFGLLACGLSLFLYSFVEKAEMLLGIRFVHGFMNGLIIPAAFTFLANRAEPEKRGRSVAISGAFVGMAAIIGPAYGGILGAKMGTPFIMMVNGIIMLLLAIIAFFVLRTFTYVKKAPSDSGKVFQVRQLFQHPGMQRAYAGAFFLMFSQGVLALVLPLKVDFLGYDAKISGILLSTFGIVAILVFLLPVNKIFDKAPPMVTLAFGITLMGICMILLSQVRDLPFFFIAMSLYGIGFAFLFPSINSLLIDSSDAEFRGKAYGYFYAFFSFGVVAGSSVIGFLDIGFKGAFMLTGFVLLTVALYAIWGLRNKRFLT